MQERIVGAQIPRRDVRRALVDVYHSYWDEGTDQGIRSRRGELVRKGLVADSGKRGTTRYGRSGVIWRVAS
jgi:hypothetical protein